MSPDAQWSKNLFNSLSDGGSWGVPRSGLIFNRRGNELILVCEMPYTAAMPCTPELLRFQQDSDFEIIREKFAEAGVTVRKELA